MKQKAVILIIAVTAVVTGVLIWAVGHQETQGAAKENFTPANSQGTESLAALESAPENVPGSEGWIRFPGTDIDNAVMQAEDNEYYLGRNEDGKADEWGCYFADFECSADSQNYIIYGHSPDDDMDGQRFSQLKRLNLEEFAAEYNIVEVVVDGKARKYQIFSSGYASDLTDHVTIAANPDKETMQQIIDMALARSQHDYGVKVTAKDKIITLSTCSTDPNMRYVVVGKRTS